MTRTTSNETHHPKAETCSLILANLTDAEWDRFNDAHIGYSGSTKDKGAWGCGPYIATFWSNLSAALYALRWTHISMTIMEGQVIIRRKEPPR